MQILHSSQYSCSHCIVANNNSKIPTKTLNAIVDVLESRSSYIIAQWNDVFGESKFYC